MKNIFFDQKKNLNSELSNKLVSSFVRSSSNSGGSANSVKSADSDLGVKSQKLIICFWKVMNLLMGVKSQKS